MNALTTFGRCLLLLVLARVPLHAQAAAAGSPPPPAPAARLTASFPGVWVGTLEYRDYTTDAQTFLPTWLTITAAPDGNTITLAYLYDDGPAKVVREQATLTFNTTVNTATLSTRDDSGEHTDLYEVKGLPAFRQAGGRGILTLTGTGEENGKPVATRIVLTLGRNLYVWRKETRPQHNAPDGPEIFRFRDAYTFTREKPPVP